MSSGVFRKGTYEFTMITKESFLTLHFEIDNNTLLLEKKPHFVNTKYRGVMKIEV